jgi:8-oxo-dGTP diphosphatase
MSKTATVAVINSDKKVLILRRGVTAPWMPHKYCLPGGHVEDNESAQHAAVRELNEETGIVFPSDKLHSISITFSNTYIKTLWIANVVDPNVILNFEHDHYCWISYRDRSKYNLVPRLSYTLKNLYNNQLIVL